jgi:4-hydroxy-3-methylbut-2-enyl diphosphate reductase
MTSHVVTCAPSWLEERAVSPVLGRPVVHSGVGRRRSRRTAATAALRGADAVAVTGIAGGLDPRIRAGDVVVADRVWQVDPAGGDRTLPSARLLAARLRRDGLRVWLGPVVSADHVVAGAEREALRARGALAVDMESAWLLRADRPGAVVRVVADVEGEALLRPATLQRLRSSMRTLPLVAPGLRAWGDAVGPRSLLLAEPRSFCAGVERAVEVVERALEQRGAPVYVRKQIVHNQHVVTDLQSRGAVFVEDLDQVPVGTTVVFSAHGVSPAVWQRARERGLDIIDATCPLVSKVHSELRRFSARGDTVIFIGHAGHEETEGTMGEDPERTVLVESVDDALRVEVADPEQVSYLVQTTLSVHDVHAIVEVLRTRFPALKAPPSDDICYATTNRQEALTAVASSSDLVLVVGSQNSSNSLRLVETARRLGAEAHLVDDADDVDLDWLNGVSRVGLTAGASAPQALVDEVVDALSGLGPTDIRTRTLVTEDVRFTLPKEVRSA